MNWNYRSDLPIYSQLVEQLKSEIVSGALMPGDKLGSVRDLAVEAKVNPNTMQKALSQLEDEGLVVTHRTSGRTITEDVETIKKARAELVKQHTDAFIKKMRDLGFSLEEIIKTIEPERI